MLRLVAYAPNGTVKFPIGTGRLLIGRSADCDLVLAFPGVKEVHAVLTRQGSSLKIEANTGCLIQINGEAMTEGCLELLDEVLVGDVTLVLEDTKDRPTKPVPGPVAGTPGEGTPFPTDPKTGISMARQRLIEHSSHLSSWVLSDSGSDRSLESVLAEMIKAFGGGAVYLFEGMPESEPPIKLLVTRNDLWIEHTATVLEACREHARVGPGRTLGHFSVTVAESEWLVCFRATHALDREYFGAIVVPSLPFEGWTPEVGFATITDLVVLGLVHHVGRYEPILPGRGEPRELTLVPGLVVGPSPRMARLVEAMESVADTSNNVMILGEPGTGRELVARSLHGSGPGRLGPFVVVDCDGVDAAQLGADIFGAEVQGRSGPVRREGKIQLATDGTLYLKDVDQLPLPLQARLMRVLRSRSVSGPGLDEQREVKVRIMATSGTGLSEGMGADRFRVDLAATLCQFVLEVPALRDRAEDLPLLLQTLVNRFSHETGKRVRGITTRTLQALAAHRFPGNLLELENAVRQMISLAGDGSPLDLELLPSQIRRSSRSRFTGTEVLEDSSLRTLVASVERRAISEALEKCRGNKSKAARLLSVSRNGLTQKMRRYQL